MNEETPILGDPVSGGGSTRKAPGGSGRGSNGSRGSRRSQRGGGSKRGSMGSQGSNKGKRGPPGGGGGAAGGGSAGSKGSRGSTGSGRKLAKNEPIPEGARVVARKGHAPPPNPSSASACVGTTLFVIVLLLAGAAILYGLGYFDNIFAPQCNELADVFSTVSTDLPFNHVAALDGDSTILVGEEGKEWHLVPPLWGGHIFPHTGRLVGDPGLNGVATAVPTLADMTELVSSGTPGVCEWGEVCGVPEADLVGLDFQYRAFEDMVVRRVDLVEGNDVSEYLNGGKRWRVELAFNDCQILVIDWLASISNDLQVALEGRGYGTDAEPSGDGAVRLINDPDRIGTRLPTLSSGSKIGTPLIVAEAVDGHPGFYSGKYDSPIPYAKIVLVTRIGDDLFEPLYDWLDSDLAEAWKGVLEMAAQSSVVTTYTDPDVLPTKLRWNAELASGLATADRKWDLDVEDWFGNLGLWMEQGSEASGVVVAFPIFKNAPLYDAGLYQSGASSAILIRKNSGDSSELYGEVLSELSEEFGSFYVRWEDPLGALEEYQSVGWRLVGSVLKVDWGGTAATEGALTPTAAPAAGASCSTVACYGHSLNFELLQSLGLA